VIREKEFQEVISRLTPEDANVILEYVKQKDLEIEGLELEIEDLTKPRRRRREEE
jgi:hypothetical protein